MLSDKFEIISQKKMRRVTVKYFRKTHNYTLPEFLLIKNQLIKNKHRFILFGFITLIAHRILYIVINPVFVNARCLFMFKWCVPKINFYDQRGNDLCFMWI